MLQTDVRIDNPASILTTAVEPWSDFAAEAQGALWPLHWKELALDQDKVPLAPQMDEYARREAAGMTLVVTLRAYGKLVGYYVGFVSHGLHYATCLTLHLDMFWVHPDHRNGFSGKRLFRAVEAEARRRGVQRMYVGSKVHKDASRLFVALKYEPVETTYSVWLGS